MEKKEAKKLYKQVIKREYLPIDCAIAYYSFLCILGKIHLSNREIELLAYIAIRGTISSISAREEFCTQFNSTKQTINNIVSRLKKLNLLTKVNGKILINPTIKLDFNNDINLNINLISTNGE
jgi:DNA-binding MarR family transcriptional regulator